MGKVKYVVLEIPSSTRTIWEDSGKPLSWKLRKDEPLCEHAQGGAGKHREIPGKSWIPGKSCLNSCLFHSLPDTGTQNLSGISGLLGFLLLHKDQSVFLSSPLSPRPRTSAPFPTSPAASAPSRLGALPGGIPRNSQQEWFRIRPIQPGKSRPSSSSIPSPSSRRDRWDHRGVCGWLQGTPALLTGPGKMTLGSLFLQGSGVPRDGRCAGRRFQCHRMMQHLQKRCRLPPTEGGGVTGAK